MTRRWLACCAAAALLFAATYVDAVGPQQPAPAVASTSVSPERALVDRYCAGCHNGRLNAGGLALDTVDLQNVGANPDVWEKTVRKLRARAMPPAGSPRPDESGYAALLSYLETRLDRAAKARPNPGRTEPFRRLNRTEYQNAIRDLLGLEVDVTDLLPGDDASFGFDNVSVAGLSPTLMERYLGAAQKVSRLAIGSPVRTAGSRTVVLPPDLTQEVRFEGLSFGTRGGVAFAHTFPVDGDYTVKVQLSRDRNENVEGLTEPHQIEITLDGERLQVFTVTPNRNRMGSYYADEGVDKGLEVRVPVTAGPHIVAATFLAQNAALLETERQPYQAHFNMDRHPRVQPAVRSVSVAGPFEATGVGDTPTRRRIFTCRPAKPADEDGCARQIIASLTRRAYRRPVTEADLKAPLAFYRDAHATGGFHAGIEMALRALLASTEFLFRIERDPDGVAPGTAYRVSDLALASRLSFFLWSGPPDDRLLDVAERGELRRPAVVEREVRRMLADPRAEALSTNFAGQWLYLRNLAAAMPDARLFPDFDDNLRRAFGRETELLVDTIVTENRAVTELLTANYTFLNERLAKHYGIPNVYGDHFRRVSLAAHPERTGLLGHGSILTVTSYANRTSPVLRGKWILENMLGMPPPPPPGNVPPLKDAKSAGRILSMRERMVEHRVNPTCATCHQLMDPAGLSMENFDATGRWRTRGEDGSPIDASGSLPGGSAFEGVAGLRQALIARPEVFVGTLTEKLLTFALGRGVYYHDAPAVREILREAARNDYRFSSLVLAVAQSTPFQMRRSQ
jgi:mono/diheme cytochrome c family protein